MREIKFRAWVKSKKYTTPIGSITFGKSVLGYCPEGDFDWQGGDIDWEDIELMQYTGLKDKNGKEIYEGDILKINSQERIGENFHKHGRRKYTTGKYEEVEIISSVYFDIELGQWRIQKRLINHYETGFYQGCGRTKAERMANERVIIPNHFIKALFEVNKKSEIIGNIYENPELLTPTDKEGD